MLARPCDRCFVPAFPPDAAAPGPQRQLNLNSTGKSTGLLPPTLLFSTTWFIQLVGRGVPRIFPRWPIHACRSRRRPRPPILAAPEVNLAYSVDFADPMSVAFSQIGPV